MDKMKTVSGLVRHILKEDKRTRNSDSFLYLKVLEVYGKRKGLDLNGMSVKSFLLSMKECGFPPFESVRRARQIAQQHDRNLAAEDPVDAYRLVNEERVRRYVRGAKYEQSGNE